MADAIVTQPAPTDVRYDRWGRLLYPPELHAKQGLPWTAVDQQYLIDHYAPLASRRRTRVQVRTVTDTKQNSESYSVVT
ncbi:hypothetical protein CEK28_08740 [Xenophilus sp. AP218F]|nr:hypothetical protein CEK28_08740 [Xenophilus sp. AP218F]